MEDGTTEIAAPADMDSGRAPESSDTVAVADTRLTVPLPAGPSPDDTLPAAPLPADERRRIQYSAGAASVLPPVAPAHDPWMSPTLTDTNGPTAAVPYYEATPGAAVGRSRRSRRGIVAVVVALLVIAGGSAVAYVHFRSHPVTPAQAVQQYFADLAAGDTAAAMTQVADASTYTASADPLLTATALAQPAARPGHVGIVSSRSDGHGGAAVAITYDVGGTTVHQTIAVAAVSSGTADGQPFVLHAPFITLAVGASGGRPVTVNGLSYPSDADHTLAFPGSYVATVAGNQLIASATAAATYNDSTPGTVRANIGLPAPTVAAGAEAIVQTAVNTALRTCAASTSPTPANNCPLRYDDAGATMKWTIATYPVVIVQIGGDGTVTFGDSGHAGSVHYTATTTDWIGFTHTNTGNATVDVGGTASLTTSGVTVTLN